MFRATCLMLLACALSCVLVTAGEAQRGEAKSQADVLRSHVAHYSSTIQFFTVGKGRWMVHRRHDSCSSVLGRPQVLCVRSRVILHRSVVLRTRSVEQLAILDPPMPPHHQLWMCIHGGEAQDWHNADTGGNGHYGGLQMHPGWGYGTSEYASDDSQSVQEWSAERAFRASNFSVSWLEGQWGYDSHCFTVANLQPEV